MSEKKDIDASGADRPQGARVEKKDPRKDFFAPDISDEGKRRLITGKLKGIISAGEKKKPG